MANTRTRDRHRSREAADPGAALRHDWWRRGWLLDANGSADWEMLDEGAHSEAAGLARRFDGRLVRLRGVPDGYDDILNWDGPASTTLDPGPHGIVSVLSPGWPGGPTPPSGAMLLGPVSFLVGALRRYPDGGPR